jgi:osmoprotectant transport system permease protein
VIALVIAWPLGIWLGRARRGGTAVVLVSNLTLAVPVLALLTVLPLTALGFGPKSVIVALAIFAIPPLLATAYTGMREIDPEIRDAARGMGLSSWQRLWGVELPLAVPYLASGLRTAAVQVAATAALASFVNGGGLGTIIAAGFGLGIVTGGGQILAGGLLVVALALTIEGIGAVLQRLATPRPLRQAKSAT